MKIPAKFLKKYNLGTQASFTNLVKRGGAQLNNLIEKSFDKLWKNDYKNKWNEADGYGFDYNDFLEEYDLCGNNGGWDSELGQCMTCCGVFEIGQCEGNVEKAELEFLVGLHDGYKFFVYYSVDPKTKAALTDAGFKCSYSFQNPNSGRVVSVMNFVVE